MTNQQTKAEESHKIVTGDQIWVSIFVTPGVCDLFWCKHKLT